jgi:hypothetical protein
MLNIERKLNMPNKFRYVQRKVYGLPSYYRENLSDGSHSFNELYYQREVLFSYVLKNNPSISWRSKKQRDGNMPNGFFLCGIDTPDGQFTYHYKLDTWNLFDGVKEIDMAPEYDGHTSKDVVRILSIK